MLTITLTDGSKRQFILPGTRELAFRNAWYAMSDSSRFAGKKFKLTTAAGKELYYKVGEIKDCKVTPENERTKP